GSSSADSGRGLRLRTERQNCRWISRTSWCGARFRLSPERPQRDTARGACEGPVAAARHLCAGNKSVEDLAAAPSRSARVRGRAPKRSKQSVHRYARSAPPLTTRTRKSQGRLRRERVTYSLPQNGQHLSGELIGVPPVPKKGR